MLGKYINQFMADNELSVNEEFFIENMDGNRVLIGCADRYKIEDVDGGILTAAVMNEKDKPPAMLLEAALIDLLRENYLVKKKPFYPVVGEYYYYISPSGNVIYANFTGCAEDLLLCKYIGVTGGKDYKLNLYAGTEYDTMAALIRISYSQSINNTTPSVTDY